MEYYLIRISLLKLHWRREAPNGAQISLLIHAINRRLPWSQWFWRELAPWELPVY